MSAPGTSPPFCRMTRTPLEFSISKPVLRGVMIFAILPVGDPSLPVCGAALATGAIARGSAGRSILATARARPPSPSSWLTSQKTPPPNARKAPKASIDPALGLKLCFWPGSGDCPSGEFSSSTVIEPANVHSSLPLPGGSHRQSLVSDIGKPDQPANHLDITTVSARSRMPLQNHAQAQKTGAGQSLSGPVLSNQSLSYCFGAVSSFFCTSAFFSAGFFLKSAGLFAPRNRSRAAISSLSFAGSLGT